MCGFIKAQISLMIMRLLPASEVCKGPGNSGEGEKLHIPPALFGAYAFFHSYGVLSGWNYQNGGSSGTVMSSLVA